MTAVKCTEVRCDCCHEAMADYDTAATLRARMRAHGWRVGLPGGRDLCPSCAEWEK